MPLGNLTSQFFANIYLNELDQYVKHELKIEYYLRYVDDFIIIHRSKERLEYYKQEINKFLLEKLEIELHPEKTKIIPLSKGITFVGFRTFYHYRILRKKAQMRIKTRINNWKEQKDKGIIERQEALERLLGWMAYAINGDTYKLRRKIMSLFNQLLPAEFKEKKTTITIYNECLKEMNIIVKDDTIIKKIFSYIDIKRLQKLEYQNRKILNDLITELKNIDTKEFLSYFALLLEKNNKLKILIVYNTTLENLNDIKNKIKKACSPRITPRIIKLSEFIREKDNKQNNELQEIINYGYPIFGNQLYYELVIKEKIN